MLAPSCFVPIPPFFQRQMCEFLVDESIDISFFFTHSTRRVVCFTCGNNYYFRQPCFVWER